MADVKKIHGDPMNIASHTGEPEAATPFRVVVKPEFVLDLTQFGGPVVPIQPTRRIIDRIVRTIAHGTPGELEKPSTPQPNAFLPQLEQSSSKKK